MKTIYCDFETYSEIDIKVGSFRYAQDKSTEIVCLAYGPSKDKVKLWYPGMPEPKDLIKHIEDGGLIRAWNATFEYAIFNYVGSRLHDWPTLQPEQMRCTQADALALSMPAPLAQCAPAVGSTEIKDKEGKRLITLLSKPRKATKNKPYTRVTKDIDPESYELFYKYCIQDVITEIGIGELLPRKIKDSELDLFHLTLRINERGIPIDLPLVYSIMDAKSQYESRLNREIVDLTKGALVSTGSRPQSLTWLEEQGVKLDGYTKADVRAALEKDIPEDARRFLEIRSELSRTPVKKFDFLNMAVCADETIKNNIIYHKATTGRYAGAGFQIQNLPRDSTKEPEVLIKQFKDREGLKDINVYNEAIKLVRPVLTAPRGQKLVVSDFSSIENRVIAWLAGDRKTLDNFVKGIGQYKDAASGIYHVPIEEVNKDQRQLGKVAVLSCGFGGGAKTFRTVCADQWGINISEEESKDIVDGYRAKYHKIVKMWYALYDAAMNAIISPGRVFSFGIIKFRMQGEYLYMRLPSGRLIAYYKPEIRKVMTPWGQEKMAITHMGNNTYTRKWERLTVIPGRLTENVVQAVARDFLTEAMFRVEEAGYPIVGCVHDEIISLVGEDFGSIEEYNKLMEINPIWGLDCPIAAEGYEDKRYRK